MKIVIVGDRHGKDFGREWLNQNLLNPLYDKFVFLGDWFDSYDKSLEEQIKVFNNDLEYSMWRPDDVFYCLGNHDVHYLFMNEIYTGRIPICTGYQNSNAHYIKNIIQSHFHNVSNLRFVYHFDGYLFSHAGVTNTLYQKYTTKLSLSGINEFCEFINQVMPNELFKCVDNGESVNSGPLWIRPWTLKRDTIPNIRQVFGHTFNSNGPISYQNKLINCDCSNIVILDTITNQIETI